MKKIMLVLIIWGTFTTLLGCSGKNGSTSEKMPGINMPLSSMNGKIQLMAPPEANTFKIGDVIGLVAVNNSDTPIIFPHDYGIKIFERKDNQWIPIENNFGYPEGETVLLPKAQEPFGGKIFDVYPTLPNDQSADIRIIVIGKVQDRLNSNTDVAAYIDLKLNP